MEINTKDTKRVYHFDYTINGNSFELDEECSGSIKDQLKVKGRLEKLIENKLLLTFNIKGIMIYPCSRCLDNVEESVDFNFNEEIEGTNDGVINLDDFINDCLYINEPYKILCKEDCKGLCPTCGTNLNYNQCNCEAEEEEEIDPRLAKLKNLL